MSLPSNTGSGATTSGPDALEPNSLTVGGLFPTLLVTARLAAHEALNAELAATILGRETVERGVSRSNVGGWHSHDFLPWAGAAGERLIQAARQVVDRMTLMEKGDELVPAQITWRITAWANVSRRGDSHRPHCHPAAFWSGVYWVDDGGVDADSAVGGMFEVADPRGVVPLMHAPQLRFAAKDCLGDGQGQLLTPRAGTMILFPAWLVHSVRPYAGERPRLSVAFNFAL
jgi:uncharacterized protein (TIGR02466 family)